MHLMMSEGQNIVCFCSFAQVGFYSWKYSIFTLQYFSKTLNTFPTTAVFLEAIASKV